MQLGNRAVKRRPYPSYRTTEGWQRWREIIQRAELRHLQPLSGEMGEEGRNQKENHMALRTPQFRGECPHKRSEHQDRFKPLGTHFRENDRKVSSRRGQPQAGRNQLARRYKLCGGLSRFNQNAKSVSPKRFTGLFLFAANLHENKKRKMEREKRQRGLRLWSKTNLTFGKGFEHLNQFCAAQNIPCRIPTDSIATDKFWQLECTNCRGLYAEKQQ